ncbi:MAG TPA: hypothetical protein QF572_16015 [Vicinamibacterales bacterium]|nr:hypothetical protein [Vicinamibacterales bacterium]
MPNSMTRISTWLTIGLIVCSVQVNVHAQHRIQLPTSEVLLRGNQDEQQETRRRSDALFSGGAALVAAGSVAVIFAGVNSDLCPTSAERFATVRACPAEGANTRLIGGLGLLGAGVAMMIAGGRQVAVTVSPSRVSVGYRW